MAEPDNPFAKKLVDRGQKSIYFPEIPQKAELLTTTESRIGQRDILPTQIVDRLLGTGAVVLHALNDPLVHSGNISDSQHGARGTINNAHAAADIKNTPAGNIAAVDVQTALNELDTEKSSTSHNHDHATLTNLNSASYTHLTSTQATDLTDSGDSTLHYHAADRVDANQTFTDVTTNNASTTAHGFLIKATAPAAGIRNVVAIDNGETVYKNTALLDNTAPADLAGSASAGTSLIAARRDHVHLGLTSTQLTDLTDGGLSTLHAHYPRAPHLQQSDTTDQAIANVANAQVITFDTDSHHQFITRTSSSRFTITVAGSYLITFSGVATGTSGKLIEVWLRLNGSDVANSNTIYSFKGTGTSAVIAVQFIEHFAVNDYFEFWTWGDDTSSTWNATAAGSTPTRPACPSIIITCNMISDD